jgi:hypothetical protein
MLAAVDSTIQRGSSFAGHLVCHPSVTPRVRLLDTWWADTYTPSLALRTVARIVGVFGDI